MNYAPIAVFAFNRPTHLQQTLEALAANDLAAASDLTIFCDGPRDEAERLLTERVRAVAEEADGFRSVNIVRREQNLGCARAVSGGLHEMFSQHDRLIVIEDDILCSIHTLSFLNNCLEKYASEPVVFTIAAWSPPPKIYSIPADYPYDAYFTPRFHCWGWASWRDRFDKVDWPVSDYAEFKQQPYLQHAYSQGGEDVPPMLKAQMEGKLDSWAIKVDYSRFKHGCLGLNPVHSYTTNTGMGCGTHTKAATTAFDNDLSLALTKPRLPDHIFTDREIVAGRREACSPKKRRRRTRWRRAVDRLFRLGAG